MNDPADNNPAEHGQAPSPERTARTVRVSACVGGILQLDDIGRFADITIKPDRGGYSVTGTPEQIADFIEEIKDRAFSDGWDQPPSWYRACRAAYRRLTRSE